MDFASTKVVWGPPPPPPPPCCCCCKSAWDDPPWTAFSNGKTRFPCNPISLDSCFPGCCWTLNLPAHIAIFLNPWPPLGGSSDFLLSLPIFGSTTICADLLLQPSSSSSSIFTLKSASSFSSSCTPSVLCQQLATSTSTSWSSSFLAAATVSCDVSSSFATEGFGLEQFSVVMISLWSASWRISVEVARAWSGACSISLLPAACCIRSIILSWWDWDLEATAVVSDFDDLEYWLLPDPDCFLAKLVFKEALVAAAIPTTSTCSFEELVWGSAAPMLTFEAGWVLLRTRGGGGQRRGGRQEGCCCWLLSMRLPSPG